LEIQDGERRDEIVSLARQAGFKVVFPNGSTLEDYDIRRFFSLEEYFDLNAANYYEALQSVEKNNGDLTRWLEYFTLGLSIELSKIKDKVENISVDVKLKEKLGGQPLMLSERQLKIIEYIQNHHCIKMFLNISECVHCYDWRS